MKLGFDNEKYLKLQAEHIRERRAQFGGKLYLEFGGKLFDDYHVSRVLPGFQPDSKIRMLATMRDEVEIVIAICAGDIEKNKVRGDLGISYDDDVLRLIDVFRELGFYVGSVVITQYAGQAAADSFIKRLTNLGVRCYKHYPIAGYPLDVENIVSENGFGKNDYIETSRELGIISGGGGIDKPLSMSYISKRSVGQIHYGDVVVTSGENGNYMRDIPIATLTNINTLDYDSSLDLELAPILDFNRLETVLIVDPSQGNDRMPFEEEEEKKEVAAPVTAPIIDSEIEVGSDGQSIPN